MLQKSGLQACFFLPFLCEKTSVFLTVIRSCLLISSLYVYQIASCVRFCVELREHVALPLFVVTVLLKALMRVTCRI
ncbi:hypothetical protein HK25_02835 [Acetobacter sp. DsW_059]|nr:hypothetical protein HK25_02835 [Acetobacter sp. DsW_059]